MKNNASIEDYCIICGLPLLYPKKACPKCCNINIHKTKIELLNIDKVALYLRALKGAFYRGLSKVFKFVQGKVISVLTEPKIETYSFDSHAGMVVEDLDLETKKSLKDSIGIVPEFSAKLKRDLTLQYNQNLNEVIADFSDKEIIKLRNLVSENYFGGWRLDRLEAIIEQEYGVTKSKAAFLARQETSLLVAKYSELRYREMGITKFKWSTVPDDKVRDEHKELAGKIFSFDDPPIIDKITGKRGLPGQAFGCRCMAIPIVEGF